MDNGDIKMYTLKQRRLTCPHVVASVVNEIRADVAVTLQTPMQRDVQRTNRGATCTACRDVQISSGIHTCGTIIARLGKGDNSAGQCTRVLGIESTVQLL